MDSLNNRQIEFIKLLLEENEYKTIKYFAVPLKTSQKTLQKDLKIIQKYLDRFNITLNRKPGTGIMIANGKIDKWHLLNNLKSQEKTCRKVSVNERRVEIALNMLINSGDTTSIQKLSDMYFVSKTSISADLNCIEKWAVQFNLKLEKNIEGTKIKGTEVDIRKAIASLLDKYFEEDCRYEDMKELSSRLDLSTVKALSGLFDKDKIIYINQYLVELEKKYSCRLNDPYYTNLLTHILISLTRGLDGKQIKENIKKNNDECLKFERSYEEAVNMVNKINGDFNVKLGESEIYYLYQYFVSSGLVKNTNKNAEDVLNELNSVAKTFTKKITSYMEEIMHINISSDEIIMESLLMHVRPMLNRLNYDIKISNPLIEDIKEQCGEILEICKAVVLMVCHDLKQKTIPIDEIGYLTLYYQTAMERLPVKKRVFVVCQSGVGTSQLLTTRIRKAFPQWEIEGVLSVSMLKEQNLDYIDFIVSTVPLDIKDKPYILVSAFLNDEDIKNISKMLMDAPLETSNIQTTTFYISKSISEDNIYFNKQHNEIIESLNKKYKSRILFYDISFSEEIQVYIGFFSKDEIFAMNINHNTSFNKKIEFYIAAEDTILMTHILSEIYNNFVSKKFGKHIKKYKNTKDVMDYLRINEKEMKFREDDLERVINREVIKLDMEAETKEEALLELTKLLYKAGFLLDEKAFLNDVYDREKLGPSGIGNGIAIPHGKSKFVNKTTVAIGRSKKPIKWGSLDGNPINYIILFAVKDEDKDNIENCVLSQVASKLGDDEICKNLLNIKTPEEIYEIFSES